MANFELNLVLELNLTRLAMISIAEILWKSLDVINEISKFNKQEFKTKNRWLRYLHQGSPDSVKELSSSKYQAWEEIIDYVLKKSNGVLILPCELKGDLQKIIVLMGQKLFYFYDEFWEVSKRYPTKSCLTREYFRCKKCIEGAGTEHFYKFSSTGTILMQCAFLHSKPIPPQDTHSSNIPSSFDTYTYYEKFKEFLDEIVNNCDIATIEKYEKEIMTFLNSLQPGLSFKNKEEVPLSIICLWKLMSPKKMTKDQGYCLEYDQNGYVKVPKKYLSKSKEFTLSLEVIPQLCAHPNVMALQYFASKLLSLETQQLFSVMGEVFMAYEALTLVNNRLHYFPAPDYSQDKVLKLLSLLSLDQKYNFIENHINKFFMFFLPVWPHQEMVSKIFDLCEERKLDLDYKFLFNLITMCIGIENRNKYKLQKGFYLQMFERLWSKAPEYDKMIFFEFLTETLIRENPDNPILSLILKDELLRKCAYKYKWENENEIYSAIRLSWRKLLFKDKFDKVKKFVNGLNFLEHQLHVLLIKYVYQVVTKLNDLNCDYFAL